MITLLLKGGMFIIPLLMCSVVGLAIIVDRWLYLRSAARESEFLLNRIDDLSRSEDMRGIESHCETHRGLLADIFRSGVRKFHQLESEPDLEFVQKEISKVMEDASVANTNDLERRLPMLGSVGNVAPLFGFAGTVTGMIRAFRDIAATANPNAQVVASGIEEALVTTAAGLLIAIPAVLFYNYFVNWIDALNARTEESANGLLDALVMVLVKRRQQQRKQG
jgi:biopolymer transport protein ExbB